MTIFSTAEEQQREPLEIGGKVLFYPDFALRTAGGDVSVLAPWSSYVLQDRELISGQNPFSDQALLKLLLPALVRRRRWFQRHKNRRETGDRRDALLQRSSGNRFHGFARHSQFLQER
jgi:hypothetical protein